jgi:hypothetical protein
MISPVHFLLRVPARVEAQARHALGVLSDAVGIPFRVLTDPEQDQVDVVYSDTPVPGLGRLRLPCNVSAYEPDAKHTHLSVDETTVWGREEATPDTWDLIGTTFRLISLLDEDQVSEEHRDRRGVFSVSSLPAARERMCAEPLVGNHAAILLQRLSHIRAGLKECAVPRWPSGKQYAVVLTHDTDAVSLGAGMEMLYNLAKGLIRRDTAHLRMFRDGFRYLRKADRNPLFGFPQWREIEAARLRSCFFLYAKSPKLKRDLNDCRSSVVEQGIDWNLLRSMADDGWEFGFHAPIHAKEDPSAFVWGKEFIERQLGKSISGLRHHYWALDWCRPYLTFRLHEEAGFHYDASVAWRDRAGLRAGTCLPYVPFDLERQAPMKIWEVPTSLMDGHICRSSEPVEKALADALDLIRRIKLCGGVLMLDWHTEAVCNEYRYKGDLTRLLEVLSPVLEDSAAWVTTPWALIQHWSARHHQIEAMAQNPDASIVAMA